MINIPINASTLHQLKDYQQKHKNNQVINGHGIHDTTQLILVGLLILISVTAVYTTNEEIHQHDRYMRTYFNLNLLGKNDFGIYEQGLNIDQCQMEFTTLTQIKDHFQKIFNISSSVNHDGIVLFTPQDNPFIIFQLQNRDNQVNRTTFKSEEEAAEYFHYFQSSYLKSWLLQTYQFKLTINFGENKFVRNYSLIAQYKLHSLMMIKVKLNSQFKLKQQKHTKLNGLRIIQQIIAAILIVIYLYNVFLLSQNSRNHRLFSSEVKFSLSVRRKYRIWYIVLAVKCAILLVSQKYAPICAFLQTLPLFQFPELENDKQSDIYNFNKNLRFSFPFIMAIFLQLFIVLNGFILYSMLMYPGDYFDDYLRGFFSYIYQMFQVGTYQIFTELQSYGNFAYMLYALLYFYVFQLGNALIPALFVIMIEMKITQRFLKTHIAHLVHHSACPKCLEKNSHEIGAENTNIVINSSRLSPLINRNKLVGPNSQSQNESSKVVLQIEDSYQQLNYNQNGKFHQNAKFTRFSKRILHVTRKLQLQIFKNKEAEFLQSCLFQIQEKKVELLPKIN